PRPGRPVRPRRPGHDRGDPSGRPGRWRCTSMSVALEKDVVTWDALEALVAELAERVGSDFDVLLAITRGGLVPAGMLAYRLGIRNILVAAGESYDAEGHPGP